MRPNPLTGLTSFTYGPGVAYIGPNSTLSTTNVPFEITADIDAVAGEADGVIAAIGGKTAGWSLYVKDGLPTFYYNFFEVAGYRAQSSTPLPQGKSTVRVEFTPEEKGYGKPAAVKLFMNGKETGSVRVERTVPVAYSVEGLDIGMDNISPVSPDYESPFTFGGKILRRDARRAEVVLEGDDHRRRPGRRRRSGGQVDASTRFIVPREVVSTKADWRRILPDARE